MKIITAILILAFTLEINAQDAGTMLGTWELLILDSRNVVVTTMKIQFTKDKAESCISGDWQKVKVISSSTKDPQFFPVNDELSYRQDGNQLSIGRNYICDAYLHLIGDKKGYVVHGEYIQFGWGKNKLGSFSLRKL